MKKSGPLPGLVGSMLIVAALITVLVQGGWFIWLPVGLALAAVGRVMQIVNR